jgi:hypothetical protein
VLDDRIESGRVKAGVRNVERYEQNVDRGQMFGQGQTLFLDRLKSFAVRTGKYQFTRNSFGQLVRQMFTDSARSARYPNDLVGQWFCWQKKTIISRDFGGSEFNPILIRS